jgi:hypothetical protein
VTLTKKLVIINLGGIAGAALSVLLVSENTRVSLWLASVVLVLGVLNVLVVVHSRRNGQEGTHRRDSSAWVLIALILVALALVLKYFAPVK